MIDSEGLNQDTVSCTTDTVLDDRYPSDDIPAIELPAFEAPRHAVRTNGFTFITQMIGGSLLSIPYVSARLGLVLLTTVITIVLIVALVLILQVVNACYYTNAQTFKQVTRKVLGPWLAVCIDAALILNNYGFLVSYIIISAQSFHTLLTTFFPSSLEGLSFDPYLVLKAGLTFGVMFPLSLLRNVRILGTIASAGLGLIILTVFSVILYYFVSFLRRGQICMFQSIDYAPGIRSQPPLWPRAQLVGSAHISAPIMGGIFAISYIPMLMGSFSIHAGAPPVLYELHGSNDQRLRSIRRSIYYAYAFCFLMYMLMGCFGALLYGYDVSTNILYSFKLCGKDIYLTIVGIAYGLMVCIAYPLIQYPLKISLIAYCRLNPKRKLLNYLVYAGFSIAFALLAFTLAALYDNIASIFGLFGSICGVLIYFVVPILLWHKLPKLKARSPIIDRLNILLQPQTDVDDIRDVTTMAFLGVQHYEALPQQKAGPRSRAPSSAHSTALHASSSSYHRYKEYSFHFVSAAHQQTSCDGTTEESDTVPLLAPVSILKRNELLQPIECMAPVDDQIELELSKQTEETRQRLLMKMTPFRRGVFYSILIVFIGICTESLIVNVLDFASVL
ncbi:Amino acid transporter family [Giardia lamblia P15]|uniref:Amino acid transporter family n=1 Tax=Giardia intestinalis (strain P15) TaxID=658858 RepID=E1EX91_GIAIA|nr:Amino acid transporter family [Giardia lamblia P15]